MQNRATNAGGNPAPLAPLVSAALAALLPIAGAGAPLEARAARARRTVARQLEQLVCRALWRAERRGRRVPRSVRQSVSWVMAQRRKIAYELERATAERFGAGAQLAGAIAERACKRFPRDGIVLADDSSRPARGAARANGTAPRQLETNPRAKVTNPRAVGDAPRQRRARAAEMTASPSTGMHA